MVLSFTWYEYGLESRVLASGVLISSEAQLQGTLLVESPCWNGPQCNEPDRHWRQLESLQQFDYLVEAAGKWQQWYGSSGNDQHMRAGICKTFIFLLILMRPIFVVIWFGIVNNLAAWLQLGAYFIDKCAHGLFTTARRMRQSTLINGDSLVPIEGCVSRSRKEGLIGGTCG